MACAWAVAALERLWMVPAISWLREMRENSLRGGWLKGNKMAIFVFLRRLLATDGMVCQKTRGKLIFYK